MENNNKLIAEFMGIKVHETWHDFLEATYYNKNYTHQTEYISSKRILTEEEVEVNNSIDYSNSYKAPKYNEDWNLIQKVVSTICEYQLAYPEEVSKVANLKIVVIKDVLYSRCLEFVKFLKSQQLK